MAARVSSVVRMVNRTAAQNFEAYVDAGRHCQGFGPVRFDDPVWLVNVGTASKPGGSVQGALSFTQRPARITPAMDAIAFEEPFCSFVKALVRLDEQCRPRNVTGHRRTIATARLLYRASEEIGHDPRAMSGATFVQAEVLLKAAQDAGEYSASTAYRMGVVLERIARTLTEAGIAGRRVDFRNSLPRQREVRPKHDLDERMPQDAALKALFAVSAADLTDPDRLMIRLVEFLWCAPWRLNEVIRLPVDCEVHQPRTINGVPALDANGSQIVDYGIRYSGSKGFLADVKWIPTAMVSVAKRAVAEIREITAAGREVCLWLERNPGRAWLFEPWRGGPPESLLSSKEAATALGLPSPAAFIQFAGSAGIELIAINSGAGRSSQYRQGDIEAVLLSRIKPIAGNDGLKRSEYLFTVPTHFFGATRCSMWTLPTIITHCNVSQFLGSRTGVKSIFERLDLRDPDGIPFTLRTHQIRHLLNTMAAENGLGEMERARWSGRSDIGHNGAYDHETGYQLAERARRMLEDGRMRGPIAMTFERLPPVERSAFSQVHLATVHTTDLGMCLHDWGAAPCMHHGACADCRDCAVVKGDSVHRARVELLLDEEAATLSRAISEVEDGTYGASNFVDHHSRMIAGYRRMLEIHDDASIVDGTLVQLDPEPARSGMLEDADLLA